ncbi:hypothetical protein HMPREF1531_01837 [Propionibacterium sp. oral taxon 192 str. F0372]|uniref:DUF2510 domain-containing protein n=1 Tax=Propionibacterium sp. oral taxon 192 TaxID=671222 RepID=UPI000352F98C|nr:DUF2510 domain-containing protein [Propionibacterium sp. oral taxon 192]EPH02529.1 hypothetical protein HMPREF1531_01837 [Propionibacterium sp. oral taxon 192 str. F0372]
MSTSGWYPDPTGAPGRFRYWDGSSWGSSTSSTPAGEPGQTGDRTQRDRILSAPVVLAAVLLVVVAIFLWMLLGDRVSGGFTPAAPDTNSAAPTISGWDETSKPTPPPVEQGDLAACPNTNNTDKTKQKNDGRLHGGGISAPKISGWTDSYMYLDWISDYHVQLDNVRPGWVSNIGVGQVNAEDGFTDAQTTARQTIECFSTTHYYEKFTHRVDLINEQTTVSGKFAWHARAEVHVNNPSMPEIDGDVVDVLIIDVGDPKRMGIFVSSVTIGDTARQRKVDAVIADLRVET